MPRWTVDDALRVTARFAEWLATGDANRLAQSHVWCFIDHPDENDDLLELACRSNAALAHEIRAQSPIWCDPGMVDLLAADLTTFCRLDGLGLEVTGQRLQPDREVLA
jgi:hypothetical protein